MESTKLPPRKEIAPRLFGLRDAVGMSPEELATAAGVSVETVLGYESGDVEIPVSYLADVAHICGVDVTALISGGEAHLDDFTLVRAGEGLRVDRRKDYTYQNLAAQMVNRRMEPFLVRVPCKAEDELHFNEHNGHEFIYLLEGTLELRLNERILVMNVGDSVYFDSRIPHALRGLNSIEVVMLDVIS